MLILLLLYSLAAPLQYAACSGRVDVCRLLVESKANVVARDKCFSPPLSHHLLLTVCLAVRVALHCI
jgi:hypothetical protein